MTCQAAWYQSPPIKRWVDHGGRKVCYTTRGPGRPCPQPVDPDDGRLCAHHADEADATAVALLELVGLIAAARRPRVAS